MPKTNTQKTQKTSLQTIAIPRAKTPWVKDVVAQAFPDAVNASDSSHLILLLLFAIETVQENKIVLMERDVEKIGKYLPKIKLVPTPNSFSDRYRSVSISKPYVSTINSIIEKSFPCAKGYSDNLKTLLLIQFAADTITKNNLTNIPIPDLAGVRIYIR